MICLIVRDIHSSNKWRGGSQEPLRRCTKKMSDFIGHVHSYGYLKIIGKIRFESIGMGVLEHFRTHIFFTCSHYFLASWSMRSFIDRRSCVCWGLLKHIEILCLQLIWTHIFLENQRDLYRKRDPDILPLERLFFQGRSTSQTRSTRTVQQT